MKRWLFLLCFCTALFGGGTNSGRVYLLNDTPFILTATILAADGSYLGEMTLQPGQQTNFVDNVSASYEHPGFPNVSYTPFTVIWQCASEEYYATCTGVSPGGFVRASDCSGNHFCAPKKKGKSSSSSTLQKKGQKK